MGDAEDEKNNKTLNIVIITITLTLISLVFITSVISFSIKSQEKHNEFLESFDCKYGVESYKTVKTYYPVSNVSYNRLNYVKKHYLYNCYDGVLYQ